MGQSNISTSKNTTSFIGTRYLPVLNFNTKSDSILSSFSIEVSGNLNFSRLSLPNKEIERLDVKPNNLNTLLKKSDVIYILASITSSNQSMINT